MSIFHYRGPDLLCDTFVTAHAGGKCVPLAQVLVSPWTVAQVFNTCATVQVVFKNIPCLIDSYHCNRGKVDTKFNCDNKYLAGRRGTGVHRELAEDHQIIFYLFVRMSLLFVTLQRASS